MIGRMMPFVGLLAVGQLGALAAQGPTDPWYSRSSKPKDFQVPKLQLGGKFTVELPKDWQIARGYSAILFSVAEKTRDNQPGATIALEQLQLQSSVSVTPGLAQTELTNTQDREPDGKDFARQIKETAGRRFIFIQYTRPGLVGRDSVVQYSVPIGSIMYRLICIAPTAQLPKYQPIFAHVAASFQPSAPPGD